MARDINRRLASLQARRRGTDRIAALATDSMREVLAKSLIEEAYVKRAASRRYTKYALGAMQAVDADYTRIGLEEADRVGRQIASGLIKHEISVEFRLQGSVPADIHIRGVSDVDLLVLDDRFIRYNTEGLKALRGEYLKPVSYDTLTALLQLRSKSEAVLEAAFPAATVDKSGAKAIKLSGGSLRRPIDVVPSNWFDTLDYQATNAEEDRGVEVLNKDVPARVLNMPFRHIHRIDERDSECFGGLKKAIRLCKNVKADAINEGAAIELSSFDIASALWHSNLGALTVGIANELAILAEATRHLKFLSRNRDYASRLKVPDGTRAIFDVPSKLDALDLLSSEMDDLADKVVREQTNAGDEIKLSADVVADVLRKIYIPG